MRRRPVAVGLLAAAAAAVLVLAGCHPATPAPTTSPAGATGAPPARPVTVDSPLGGRLVPAPMDRFDTWLAPAELPFAGTYRWQLVRTTTTATTRSAGMEATSCGPFETQLDNDPRIGLSLTAPYAEWQYFWADGTDGAVTATETQLRYPTVAAASAALAGYRAEVDGCVAAAGNRPPQGYYPVTHTVAQTVIGTGALAFLHTVRYPNGAPASGGEDYVADSDAHEYLVQHANLIAILSVVSVKSAAIDATTGDAAVVRALIGRADTYDHPASPERRTLDQRSDQWQIWPAPTALPAQPALTWGSGVIGIGGTTIGDGTFAPGGGGALGPLACTTATTAQVAAGDPTITAHRGNGYSEIPATGTGRRADSAMALDLLYFVSPQAATAGYGRLAADMAICGPRLRQTQAHAGRAHPDATATPVGHGPGYGVWKLTGTGLYEPVPILAAPNPPGVPAAAEILLVIVARGPLVEVASIAVDATDVRLFGAGTVFATAMATAMCRYDIGCP